ncbi:MAG: nitronate monooxygenase [Alphaproteobacteria bacterium]|nr:nitronate monooxygenase [Alphaproteobacteria bacterium]
MTLPLVEGGKGIGASDGTSAGVWARAGGVGTFSGVSPATYDENGEVNEIIYKGKTRKERHQEYIDFSIEGSLEQARIAHETAANNGRIHMNVLWEMGGVEAILHGVLSRSRGLIHGITCGAGMPYKLSEIAAKYKVYYHPIVSSSRAFHALWRRSFSKAREWLGSVVYEDPWRAGGHNGLSRQEDPTRPEDPEPRLLRLRQAMREVGLWNIPIVIAGGVWCLNEWVHILENKDIAPVAFQFGTRPLLTQESPIPQEWKNKLLTLKPGDVWLNKFSPTGFYSSAVRNDFLEELQGRSDRQISISRQQESGLEAFTFGARNRTVYVTPEDARKAHEWIKAGYTEAMLTPGKTIIFVESERKENILTDQRACMGCLSGCMFSNWSQEHGSTGYLPDPRSFCIQKTLLHAVRQGDMENQLMFAGSNVFRFQQDPLYANRYIPTVEELIKHILAGN